jgi:DNA-binding CsgD family transcriptional regulator
MRPERSFVGRQRELALLQDRFAAATNGQANVVLVTGDAGIGKTRLLREMVAHAARDGATVLWGDASEAAGMPPYLPFLEALGPYIRAAPREQLHEQIGFGANTLATILPEIVERLGELPPGCSLPAAQAQLRLYEAIGAFLEAIAAAAPTGAILVLDDLQWADPTSLDLLCYIAQHLPAARLLFLGAFRDDESAPHLAFARALNQLTRLRMLTTITLSPLQSGEAAALAAGYLGGMVAPDLGHYLHMQSEGNPFFAEELVRGWQECGLLACQEREGQPYWTLVATPSNTLIPSIGGAIRLRLARLPTAVVDLLRVAAIMGRTFPAALLAQVIGQAIESTEELLLTANRAGLVRSDGTGSFTFSHDRIRECLYVEVSSSRRKWLHERIGSALEAWPGLNPAQRLAELAFHFARSSDRARGATYSRRAAEHALQSYAAHEALEHYQKALELSEPTDPLRGQLLMGLGEAGLLSAQEHRAAAAFAAAQSWFEQTGERLNIARALRGRGLACWRLGQPELAHEHLAQALAKLEAEQCPDHEIVRTLVDLADLLGVVLGRHDEAIAHGRRALELARGQRDRCAEAAACRTAGFLLVRANDLVAGVPLLERARALAVTYDHPAEAAEACAALAQAYVWATQFERSRQISRERESLAQRSQQAHHLGYVYTWLAFLEAAQGTWSAAEQLLDKAQPLAERLAGVAPTAFWHQVRGYLAYQRGDLARAEIEWASAVASFREHDPGELVLCLGPLGLVLQELGERAEARACLEEQETFLTSIAAGPLPMLSAMGCLLLAATAVGDTERTRHYYQDLLACQDQHHWFLVDRILGQAALLLGDLAAAGGHLAAADALARREGLRPELGRVLAAQADLVLAEGGPGSAVCARNLLGQARSVWRELDVPGQVKQIRQRLRSLPRQPGERPPAPLPAGLTRREAEVLKLVATGLSNRDIAEQLALSESTVAKHLSSIFAKTATDNRAAAAVFAARHGLDSGG